MLSWLDFSACLFVVAFEIKPHCKCQIHFLWVCVFSQVSWWHLIFHYGHLCKGTPSPVAVSHLETSVTPHPGVMTRVFFALWQIRCGLSISASLQYFIQNQAHVLNYHHPPTWPSGACCGHVTGGRVREFLKCIKIGSTQIILRFWKTLHCSEKKPCLCLNDLVLFYTFYCVICSIV